MSKPTFEQYLAARRFPLLSSLTLSPDCEHVAHVHQLTAHRPVADLLERRLTGAAGHRGEEAAAE